MVWHDLLEPKDTEGLHRWVKDSLANSGDSRDTGSISGSGVSPGVGNGNPLQYSYLENSMDRGAWWATVHGVVESDTTEHHHHIHLKLTQHCKINYISRKMLYNKTRRNPPPSFCGELPFRSGVFKL